MAYETFKSLEARELKSSRLKKSFRPFPRNHEKWKLISGHSIVFVQSASSFRYGESHGPIPGLELRGKSFSPQPLIFRVAKTCAGRGSRGTIMFKALVISVQRRRWGRGPRVQWLSGPEGPSFSLCSKTRFHTRQSPGSSIDCRLPQKGTKEWMEIFCKTYPSFFSKGLSVGDIQGITNSTNSQVLL